MADTETWDEELNNMQRIVVGKQTSYGFVDDPKRLGFVLSRYKFVSKMLEGKKNILEVGCGDGFGTTVVAHGASHVTALDLSLETLENKTIHPTLENKVEFLSHDIVESPLNKSKFDAAYSLDVIEHISSTDEHKFYENILGSLNKNSLFIVGTPNKSSAAYQSKRSLKHHINLKSQKDLKKDLEKYFEYVLMFSMNDEVLHTGYSEMSHYILGVGIHPKNISY